MSSLTSDQAKVAHQLIVAADYRPEGADPIASLRQQTLRLADALTGTRVTVKMNTVLRNTGYPFISEIKFCGVNAFADMKLDDTTTTLESDGEDLARYGADLVTVMAATGQKGMKALKSKLPNAMVLAVTVLTTFTEKDCKRLNGSSLQKTVMRRAREAAAAGVDGLICSPHELSMLRKEFGDRFKLVTPGIRPAYTLVAGDDQQRVMTPGRALEEGADLIVVGRPVTQAEDPFQATLKILDEMAAAA